MSLIEESEVEELDPALNFFKDIRTDRIQYFYEQLLTNRLSDLDLDACGDSLRWNDYFRLLAEITEHGAKYEAAAKRRSWHVATNGLLLTPVEREPLPPKPKKGVPPDYTEDEPSESDDSASDNEGGPDKKAEESRAAKITSNWDPAVTNPIFFGVKTSSYAAFLQAEEDKRNAEFENERRIVEKTFQVRKEALSNFESGHCARETARRKKIEELTSSYQSASERRLAERVKSEATLPAAGFRNFLVSSALSLNTER